MKKPTKRSREYELQVEVQAAFFAGGLIERLNNYARGVGLPASELAKRVGDALRAAADGALLGTEHRVPDLPRKTAKRSKAVEPLAVAERPRGKQALKRGRGATSKSYWAKLTPKQRSAEMKRRQAKWSENAKARWRHEAK